MEKEIPLHISAGVVAIAAAIAGIVTYNVLLMTPSEPMAPRSFTVASNVAPVAMPRLMSSAARAGHRSAIIGL